MTGLPGVTTRKQKLEGVEGAELDVLDAIGVGDAEDGTGVMDDSLIVEEAMIDDEPESDVEETLPSGVEEAEMDVEEVELELGLSDENTELDVTAGVDDCNDEVLGSVGVGIVEELVAPGELLDVETSSEDALEDVALPIELIA